MSVDLHEPDEMGVWSESGQTVWLPRSLYPRRIQAILWAMDTWNANFIEVRCRARHMAYGGDEGEGDCWWECEAGEPGAFPVWRLEGA